MRRNNILEIIPRKLLYYNKQKHMNDTPYGRFIFQYATEWTDLMEHELKQEPSLIKRIEYLREHAERLSLQTRCCEDGLTGFQHDCATSLLVNCWEYGFELWLGLSLAKHDQGYTSLISEKASKVIDHYLAGDIITITTEKIKWGLQE